MLARDPWARVTHGDIQVPSSALCGGIITVHHPDMDRAGAGELDRVAMCVCVFVCVFFFFGGGRRLVYMRSYRSSPRGSMCGGRERERWLVFNRLKRPSPSTLCGGRDDWSPLGLRDHLHGFHVEGVDCVCVCGGGGGGTLG